MQAVPSYAAETNRIRTIALVSAGGLLAATLLYFGIRSAVRKSTDRSESRKGFDASDASSYAKRIMLAFKNDGWFGANVTVLRRIFSDMPSWDFYLAVARSYEKQYKAPLADHLEAELDDTEYEEIMTLINALKLPKDQVTEEHIKGWERRLRNAWDVSCWLFPCTDEDAALAVLKEIRDSADPRGALARLDTYYVRENGMTMQDEAESEMSGYYLMRWNMLINDIKQA